MCEKSHDIGSDGWDMAVGWACAAEHPASHSEPSASRPPARSCAPRVAAFVLDFLLVVASDFQVLSTMRRMALQKGFFSRCASPSSTQRAFQKQQPPVT